MGLNQCVIRNTNKRRYDNEKVLQGNVLDMFFPDSDNRLGVSPYVKRLMINN